MARKRSRQVQSDDVQLGLDFEAVIEKAEVRSRDEICALSNISEVDQDYSPIARTAEYMRRAVRFEEVWESTIQKARSDLLTTDARELFLDFFKDMKREVESGSVNSVRCAELLAAVGGRGFGLDREQLQIARPMSGGTRWRVRLDADAIRAHLKTHIVGDCFLNEITPNESIWTNRHPRVGASDVSQHHSKVPVPARFFKRSVPFVLNNAAGSLFRIDGNQPRFENLFDPTPNDALLRWMLIDPSYADELEPEDYRRCLASAMDVGQFKFDLGYLLKSDKRPDIILRDGTLFPQDAYLDNFVVLNRRGEFTREAIREMLDCLAYAERMKVIYCGISKAVQLKMYSAVVDWYITRHIDSKWGIANYTLSDGQAMSVLLATPTFVLDNLQRVVTTCLIRRSFATRANINDRKSPDESLDNYFDRMQSTHPDEDITPYREVCKLAQVYMFFMGHSKSPQQQLPRYEFFYHEKLGEPMAIARAILSAIRHTTLIPDHDHSFMADQPVTYLLPTVTQQAHNLSKDVGKYIDRATGQWIMSRYRTMISRSK